MGFEVKPLKIGAIRLLTTDFRWKKTVRSTPIL
jgi:hypothetical protein